MFEAKVTGEKKANLQREINHWMEEAETIDVCWFATDVEVIPREGAKYKEFETTGEQTILIRVHGNKRFLKEGDERISDEG